MKKIVSILLAVVIAMSVVTMAAAEGYTCKECGAAFADTEEGRNAYNEHILTHTKTETYTCETCKKIFTDIREYNNHIDTHKTEEATTTTEPEQKEYQCETCKKIYNNIDDYNACVDSHFNNVNWHYDKYVDATVPDVLAQFVDIFNNTGLFDYLKEIISMLYETFVDRVLPAKEAAADAQ